ncbi:MAG: hypothetical protein JSV25_10630 [Spirochaetota bacterium]|nr:MAG: hypothetical protein JSV25_10630 [Spirochaetota bacterium]
MILKINIKSVWFIFSPLLASGVAGYLLYRYRALSGGLLAIIIVIGLVVTFINAIIVIITLSKKNG